MKLTPTFKKNSFESNAWAHSQLVCGIDEVGRGCLAGPLVTAAVILPSGTSYRYLKDSKCMSEEDRLRAYKWITKNCRYNVGILHNRIIDRHNIYQTTLMAMKKALVHLLATCPGHTHPSAILVDAMPLNISDTSYKDIPIYHFINGEKKSSSIAAASIVAKVTRDRLMAQMAPLFPAYQLASHKGYCTQTHQDAIHAHRHSVIHRLSFLNKMYQAQAEKETPRQQSLF